MFKNYTHEDYIRDEENGDIFAIENMSAKEPLNEETLEEMFNSNNYIAEEKFDGVRADIQFTSKGIRCFSRRISKKTGWYVENTDKMPYLRDFKLPKELIGTVLDGEFIFEDEPFKTISSFMNCKEALAIQRMEELKKKPTFIAFDILRYGNIDLTGYPLRTRKEYLSKVLNQLDLGIVNITQSFYTKRGLHEGMTQEEVEGILNNKHKYPHLAEYLKGFLQEEGETHLEPYITKKMWYELIIYRGGEGIMLKDLQGLYHQKRGREYTKVKRFTTKDLIILDFNGPTFEYTGKELNKKNGTWNYWYNKNTGECFEKTLIVEDVKSNSFVPVTKHFAKGWIGTIEYGVLITEDELKEWEKRNPKEKAYIRLRETENGDIEKYLCLGECSGFDEETRQYLTNNREELIGKVIEVGCHEVIKKTGKLRHPRFLRIRHDKDYTTCTYKEHLEG